MCQSLFFNKVAGLRLKGLWHRCFPVSFVKFLRTTFLQNTSVWLLLDEYWDSTLLKFKNLSLSFLHRENILSESLYKFLLLPKTYLLQKLISTSSEGSFSYFKEKMFWLCSTCFIQFLERNFSDIVNREPLLIAQEMKLSIKDFFCKYDQIY